MVDRALTTRQNANPGNASTDREARILRDRVAAIDDAIDLLSSESKPIGAARLLVVVYDGGSMPTTTQKVFFTHPIIASGAESEGGTATLTADTNTTVPVILLEGVPAVGDYLTAYSAGGRWVSEETGSGGGPFILPCVPCGIPLEDLTLTWTNTFTGTGTVAMVYSGGLGPTWVTGCTDGGLQFQLGCNEGELELRAIFFISGECPTGTPQYCSNLRSDPLAIQLVDYDCSPFSLTFTFTDADPGCPTIYSAGTTKVVITI